MAGLFDDLIPQHAAQGTPAAQSGNPFSDLIPAQPEQVPLPPPRPQQSMFDKLVGNNGPRYQTWPERLVRGIADQVSGAVTLPGDVYSGKTPIAGPDGQTNPQVIQRATDLATLATPISPAASAGEGIGLVGSQMVKDRPPVPSAETLQAAAGQGYNAARNSGLNIRPDAVAQMATGVRSGLEQDGIVAELAPKTHAIIAKLTNPPEGSFATIGNLESVRRSLQLAARDFANPTEQLAASRAIRQLDGFLEGLGPKDILAGPSAAAPGVVALPPPVSSAASSPEAVSQILREARANYAAAQRSNSLTGTLDRANTGILERAETRAQAANSGRNLDNTIRQKVASLLEKPKEVSGFNDQELQALNDVIQGTGTRNTARYIGNLLGGGGGIGQSLVAGAGGAGAGAAIGGPVGAAIGAASLPVVGAGAKTIANVLAKRSLNSADELVRSNSPLYAEMLRRAPSSPSNLATRAAMAKLLLMQAMRGQQPQ